MTDDDACDNKMAQHERDFPGCRQRHEERVTEINLFEEKTAGEIVEPHPTDHAQQSQKGRVGQVPRQGSKQQKNRSQKEFIGQNLRDGANDVAKSHPVEAKEQKLDYEEWKNHGKNKKQGLARQ